MDVIGQKYQLLDIREKY